MIQDERIYELASSQLSGNATAEETQQLQQWVDESEEHRQQWLELCELWVSATTAQERSRYDVVGAWNKFHTRYFEPALAKYPLPRRRVRRTLLRVWTVAATLLLPILLGVTIYLGQRMSHLADYHVAVSTVNGESATFNLPDGTSVVLEENSKLTYDPADFSKGKRRISFTGVAYFTVTKDRENPFLIESTDVDVRVTGTAFNLKAGPNHKYDVLSLDEGSVEFMPHGAHQASILAPGDEIIYNKETTLAAIRHRDVYGNGVARNLYNKDESVSGVNVFVSGNGTQESPYIISNARQLLGMKEVLSANRMTYFELDNDIDMHNINWMPLNGPEDGFRNWISFDGKNHVLSNFHTGDVRYKGINYYASFFGVLCGECRNVGFENVDISSVGMGAGVLGGVIGYNTYPGVTVVEDCYFTGHITSNAEAGSIAGNVMGKTVVRNCYSNVSVTSMNSYAGGIVGRTGSPITIQNCLVGGSVSGVHAGGITGGSKSHQASPSTFSNVAVACNSIFGNKNVFPLGDITNGDHQDRLLLSPYTIINGEPNQACCTRQQLREFTASMRGAWYRDLIN